MSPALALSLENEGTAAMTAQVKPCEPVPHDGTEMFESYCAPCGIHEGSYPTADDPDLLALRDQHNMQVHYA